MTHLAFIPGLNNDAGVWDPTIAALPDGLEATAYDVPAIPRLDDLADAVAAELPDGGILVGHSFGGVVATTIVARHPQKAAGLVLVNTPYDTDPPEAAEARRRRAEEAFAGKFEEFAMGRVDLVFYGDNARDDAVLAERRRGLAAYGPERYRAHSYAITERVDRTAFLAALEIPVLVVAAAHDLVIPTDDQRDLAQRVGAAYREIPRSAHMLPAEEPALLAEAVSDWTARIDDERKVHP